MNRLLPFSVLVLVAAGCGRTAEPVAERSIRAAASAAASTPATDLGTLGGNRSFATDVNNAGVVVGYSNLASGQVHAFRWTAGTGMTDLGTLPGGGQSGAIRVLGNGQILGWSEIAGSRGVPVKWDASGQIQALNITPIPEVFGMDPTDFNQRGEVVGNSFNGMEHGWYWSPKTGTIDLRKQVPSCLENGASAINANGMVAGTHCTGWLRPFTWALQVRYKDLSIGEDVNNANGLATGINDSGTVVGYFDPHGNIGSNGTMWRKGGPYILLPDLRPLFPNGVAYGINNRGVIVGASVDGDDDGFTAVVWPTSTTLVRLNRDGLWDAIALAINDGGQIAGWGISETGTIHALLWTRADGPVETAASIAATSTTSAPPRRLAVSGPAACLADRKAMASKAAMAGCVMGVR